MDLALITGNGWYAIKPNQTKLSLNSQGETVLHVSCMQNIWVEKNGCSRSHKSVWSKSRETKSWSTQILTRPAKPGFHSISWVDTKKGRPHSHIFIQQKANFLEKKKFEELLFWKKWLNETKISIPSPGFSCSDPSSPNPRTLRPPSTPLGWWILPQQMTILRPILPKRQQPSLLQLALQAKIPATIARTPEAKATPTPTPAISVTATASKRQQILACRAFVPGGSYLTWITWSQGTVSTPGNTNFEKANFIA